MSTKFFTVNESKHSESVRNQSTRIKSNTKKYSHKTKVISLHDNFDKSYQKYLITCDDIDRREKLRLGSGAFSSVYQTKLYKFKNATLHESSQDNKVAYKYFLTADKENEILAYENSRAKIVGHFNSCHNFVHETNIMLKIAAHQKEGKDANVYISRSQRSSTDSHIDDKPEKINKNQIKDFGDYIISLKGIYLPGEGEIPDDSLVYRLPAIHLYTPLQVYHKKQKSSEI